MVKFLDNLLKKMGVWFGIIFKIIIPAILFFYPFKMLMTGGLLLANILGIDTKTFAPQSQTVVIFLYVVFLVMLIFAPKVASAIEFIITPLYFISLYYMYLLLFNVQFFSLNITDSAPFININKANVILLVIFIIFKILFFFFILINKKNIEKAHIQNAKRKCLY